IRTKRKGTDVSRDNRLMPTIDDVLLEFFARQRQSRPIREDRSQRLEAHLRGCIEACGPTYISEEWWLMLQIEQCFEPEDTFARLLPADFLLQPMPLSRAKICPSKQSCCVGALASATSYGLIPTLEAATNQQGLGLQPNTK